MFCTCQIVPSDVFKRFAGDAQYSSKNRRSFSDTLKVDVEVRKLRKQTGNLARVASAMAVAPAIGRLGGSPIVNVFDCANAYNLPGMPVSTPAISSDTTVKNVFNTTTAVADFYNKVFNRHSIDDLNMALVSSVHYGSSYSNAFWNGSQMTYGDGDGSLFVDFSKGNDVIGHELTHGVTEHTLQLVYTGEAGGLNESLSDCFGSMFRQWQANQTTGAADWLIGKDIIGPTALAQGYTCLRDMEVPDAKHCLAPQVIQYGQITTGMDPHISSGPPNLAFYAASKAVGGKSWETIGQVWYRSMTGFGLSPNLKMKVFADRTRAVAAQLFPGKPAVAAAVDQGWKQVGL